MNRNMYPIVIFSVILIGIMGCQTRKKEKIDPNEIIFYKVGHRGTRGLMPESTIPAMKKAIEVGANTLETDLQVTKDNKIVLNHDYTFNPLFVLKPDGSEIPEMPKRKRLNNSFIPEDNQEEYAIYKLNYADIRKFELGQKFFPDFPEQERIKTYMPLFKEMVDSIEEFTNTNNFEPVYYMPEIKSDSTYYGSYQPYPEEFVENVLNVIDEFDDNVKKRMIIQSADLKVLEILKKKSPKLKLALLPSQENRSIEEYINQLGFVPDFFLPRYKKVTTELIEESHSRNVKVVPWTPDNSKEMNGLIKLGVDGIITNYPDRLSRIYENY